jgi:acyl-coenzyme A thioesterase PaaI-like protein
MSDEFAFMMDDATELTEKILALLRERHVNHIDPKNFPPPVFIAMQGEFLDYDPEQVILRVRFPVLETWLNPYGMMQGGMVAAAIDNTIGPLSAIIAPANVTRHMEVKYSRSITTAIGFIVVVGQLVERKARWLTFSAEVQDLQGQRLAKAKAKHWILVD